MDSTSIPWDRTRTRPWPKLTEIVSPETVESHEVPLWASQLAGLGHWMVANAAKGTSYAAIVIVPIRETPVLWVALGALMAALEGSCETSLEEGQTVWFPPKPGKQRFSRGLINDPTPDKYNLIKVDVIGRNSHTHSCNRSDFFAVTDQPSLETARLAQCTAGTAKSLGIDCRPEQCLSIESAIQISGSKAPIQAAASRLRMADVELSRLMMLDDAENGSRFSVLRLLGERQTSPDEKARIVIGDGRNGMAVLDNDAFKQSCIPAVFLLTPDEWYSGQPDSNRIDNALVDWGGKRCDWPEGVAAPGIGCLLYRKEVRP